MTTALFSPSPANFMLSRSTHLGPLAEPLRDSNQSQDSGAPSSIPSLASPSCLEYELFDEQSPLGLTLRKTPSLVDLISSKLFQESDRTSAFEAMEQLPEASELTDCNPWPTSSSELMDHMPSYSPPFHHSQPYLPFGGDPEVCEGLNPEHETRRSIRRRNTMCDKMKASTFACDSIAIGNWQVVCSHEGELVAKCYYAKRKLMWEVLQNGIKKKVEVLWGDISFLKATCPAGSLATLEVQVSRPPQFFEEMNPQPRKHTLWQPCADFTSGQASICSTHVLTFPEGELEKPYQNLLLCDPRLRSLVEESQRMSHRDVDMAVRHGAIGSASYGLTHSRSMAAASSTYTRVGDDLKFGYHFYSSPMSEGTQAATYKVKATPSHSDSRALPWHSIGLCDQGLVQPTVTPYGPQFDAVDGNFNLHSNIYGYNPYPFVSNADYPWHDTWEVPSHSPYDSYFRRDSGSKAKRTDVNRHAEVDNTSFYFDREVPTYRRDYFPSTTDVTTPFITIED